MDSIEIRETGPADEDALLDIERSAFARGDEARPVTVLLADPTARPFVSLLALEGGEPVGHILFARARLDGAEAPVHCSLLARLAVSPKARRRGIGSRLIAAGLEKLRAVRVDLVFVLGYSAYYRRAGFTPAADFGLVAPFPVAEEHADAWMALPLHDRPLGSVTGTVRFADSLNHPEYWQH